MCFTSFESRNLWMLNQYPQSGTLSSHRLDSEPLGIIMQKLSSDNGHVITLNLKYLPYRGEHSLDTG